MSKIAQNYVADFFGRSVVALQRASEDHNLHVCIMQIADLVGRALQNGNKLLIAGNGGSAADAQHLAAEFLSRVPARSSAAASHRFDDGLVGAHRDRQ